MFSMLLQLRLVPLLIMAKDSDAWSWTAQPATTTAPRVSGHVTVTDYNHERILLFGGLTGSAGSPCTDQLWRFDDNNDSDDASWHLVDTKPGPGPRMYAASAILGDAMYLMGGWDPGEPKSGGTFLDETWRLDLVSLRWKLSDKDKLPCGPVSRHAACTVGGNKMVMHTFRGVFIKTLDTGGRESSWTEQPTTGEGPEGLSMCAMTPLTDNSLLVYGGSTKTQELSEDAFVLNTDTWEWTKLSGNNESRPQARASPCAAQCGENQCIIFGGACLGGGGYEGGAGLQAQHDTWLLTVVDGTKAVWERVAVTNDDRYCGPKARLAATLTVLPSSSSVGDSGGFLLAGGWDPKGGTYNDVWVLRP